MPFPRYRPDRPPPPLGMRGINGLTTPDFSLFSAVRIPVMTI